MCIPSSSASLSPLRFSSVSILFVLVALGPPTRPSFALFLVELPFPVGRDCSFGSSRVFRRTADGVQRTAPRCERGTPHRSCRPDRFALCVRQENRVAAVNDGAVRYASHILEAFGSDGVDWCLIGMRRSEVKATMTSPKPMNMPIVRTSHKWPNVGTD